MVRRNAASAARASRYGIRRRAGGRVGISLLVAVLAGCDLFSGIDDIGALRWEADVLELVEESYDGVPEPIVHLRAGIRAVNSSADSITVTLPYCIFDLRAYPGAEPVGGDEAPAWELLHSGNWPGNQHTGCSRNPHAEAAPGDTLRFATWDIPLAEILADSLPSGPYRFEMHLSGEVTSAASRAPASAVVDLGAYTLPPSRYPLSLGSYPRDGFTHRVEVEDAPAGGNPTYRLILTHTGRTSNALTRDLSLDCPVRFLAFPTAAAREEIPVPAPEWRWPPRLPGCGDEVGPVRLEPGASWTLDADLPRGAYAHTGLEITDFYLMAIVDIEGRPLRFAVDPVP